MDLAKIKCVPCEGGTPPFPKAEIAKYKKFLKEDWEVIGDKRIRHRFRFKNFEEAINFIDKVAKVAKAENHHPDLHNYYGDVVVELTTHAIDGLSQNDFAMAAKIEKLVGGGK